MLNLTHVVQHHTCAGCKPLTRLHLLPMKGAVMPKFVLAGDLSQQQVIAWWAEPEPSGPLAAERKQALGKAQRY